ncbi:Uncharacterised protein [BD1-7 clade bacterium]|uniref:DUF2066 domain-containing protein n=1 Tax=BD1-7 clade bacterium TaxID=2029982 RepID=A0A5S9PVL9_9GAMM|nr:Uncharacterised protein [BD1-7 clade bacterium]
MIAQIRFPIVFMLVFLLGFSTSASAVVVKDLYAAEVSVSSRSQSDFKDGLKRAMARVIAKVSGLPESAVLSEPRLAVDLDQASRWVVQYSYVAEKPVKRSVGDNNKLVAEEPQLQLKARFSEVQINSLLQRAQLKFWPADRPEALVIPVLSRQGSRDFATADPMVQKAIKDAAFQYGIPVAMPDELTETSLPLDEAWFWNVDIVRQAATMQPHDAVLLARISESVGDGNPFYRGGWLLIEGENTTRIDMQATSLEQFFDQGFRWAAGIWARKYSVTLRSSGNETLMVVQSVNTAADYQAVIGFLENLDVVKSVFLLQAKSTQLELALELKTGVEQFQRLLTLQPDLQPLESSDFNLLQYQWHATKPSH